MNKEFKERLTGAVILVVFIVIVVPALLSGPQRPVAPQATAGGEGPPIRTYTIDLTDPASALPSSAASTSPPPAVAAPPAPEPGEDSSASASASAPSAASASPSAPPEAQPVPDTQGYAVQIGSFANRTNAERLVARLKAGGYAAFMLPPESGRKLYRVRVGPVAERDAAETLAARLAAAGQAGKVVTHP
ncbi:MAG: Cell division protein DedD [Steroidobacteraceae bacterium]|nr:Cell division protein DedD [Steroidobacteraceae bacterium]